jgi:hypothetical protein
VKKDNNESFKNRIVPGSLDKKGGRRCQLLLNKRWLLLPPLLANETVPESLVDET